MVIQIGEKSEGSFETPIRLLNDCHRRIEMFLNAMVTVTRQVRGGQLNDAQREALEASLRYFREAAPRHTQDEEESLFPRLALLRNPEGRSVQAGLERLKADHAVADLAHREVEGLVSQWLEMGRLPEQSAERLAGALQKLSDLYQEHIHFEENEVFPYAEEALQDSEIEDIGREMAARRGIDPKTLQGPWSRSKDAAGR